jgi:hypothetical protein
MRKFKDRTNAIRQARFRTRRRLEKEAVTVTPVTAAPAFFTGLQGMTTEDIDCDAPLRLNEAAKIAFPCGGMTAAGLRREAKRGRLVIARIAGKDFTTLNHVKRMVELCHVSQAHRDSGNGRNGEIRRAALPTPLSGSSWMEDASSALESVLRTL